MKWQQESEMYELWDVFTVQEEKHPATKLITKDARAANTSATYANITANANYFYFIISF